MTVTDDGRGFDAAKGSESAGWGLMTMRERATAMGGRLHVRSAVGQGTRVLVEIRTPTGGTGDKANPTVPVEQ